MIAQEEINYLNYLNNELDRINQHLKIPLDRIDIELLLKQKQEGLIYAIDIIMVIIFKKHC